MFKHPKPLDTETWRLPTRGIGIDGHIEARLQGHTSITRGLLVSVLSFLAFSMGGVDAEAAEMGRVLWDQAHGEDATMASSQRFVQELEKNGFEVIPNAIRPITPELLEGCDVLVIGGPYGGAPLQYPFSVSEVQAIVNFVEQGHGLLEQSIMSNSAIETANQVSTAFGVTFLLPRVFDDTNYCSHTANPIIHEMIAHPVTDGIRQFVLEEPGPFELSDGAYPIAWGDEDAYLVPPTVLLPNPPVVVASNDRAGRAVFIHEGDLFQDWWLDGIEGHGCLNDNLQLGVNTVRWLATPEPSAITLVATGLIGLLAFGWRWRRSQRCSG